MDAEQSKEIRRKILQNQLLKATSEGNFRVLKTILELGGKINIEILFTAIFNERKDILKYLLKYLNENKISFNINLIFQKTALWSACLIGNLKIVKVLLHFKANPNIPCFEMLPVRVAEMKHNFEIVPF
ncbi:hypothetical protein ABK040_006332 [Willaertia magna]